jgi:hypothetical protein
MTAAPLPAVVLFSSTAHALLAEKIAKKQGLVCKLVPVPRHLSSDCGICLLFNLDDRNAIEAAFRERVEWTDILPV